jgi:hypothetical protein
MRDLRDVEILRGVTHIVAPRDPTGLLRLSEADLPRRLYPDVEEVMVVALTREQRSLLGRIGAHSLHAKYDSRVTTEPARRAFLSRFEQEVDPEGLLPEVERLRRAEHARKAYFARLALMSARARAGRRTTRR